MEEVGDISIYKLSSGIDIEYNVEIFNFYVNNSKVYGEKWIKLMKDGVNENNIKNVKNNGYIENEDFIGKIKNDKNKINKNLFKGYLNIYKKYFKEKWMNESKEDKNNEINKDDDSYGLS